MKPFALLSMDVEDWHHAAYFEGRRVPPDAPVMLDGVERFVDVLAEEGVRATFFMLGKVAETRPALVRTLAAAGHEIASHGPDHSLPARHKTAQFLEQLREHKDRLEQLLGAPVSGYRAPCFALDMEKLGLLSSLGFVYDSSWIRFGAHPLYGSMDLSGWDELFPGVRRDPVSRLVEFEVPTVATPAGRLPVAGGAYFRFFPWTLTRSLLRRPLAAGGAYVFYTHPSECSAMPEPPYPQGTGLATRLRFQVGRRHTLPRLRRLIAQLRAAGYVFTTCSGAARVLAG
jgi:polysaccharide deacetylase family protein (PEP-CTERM system associated)